MLTNGKLLSRSPLKENVSAADVLLGQGNHNAADCHRQRKKEAIHKADNHTAKRSPAEKYAESDECFMKRDIAPPICFRSSNFLFRPFKRSERQSRRGNTISGYNGADSADQMSPQPVVAPAPVSAPTCV